MGKATAKDADLFTAGLLKVALDNLRTTHNPVTTFLAGDIEFQLTLKRMGGSRVLSRPERLLMEKVKQGHQDLDPGEIRIARRVLKRLP